jgi:uncharacterized protein YggE
MLTVVTLAAGLCLSVSTVAEGAVDQRAITTVGTGQVAVHPADASSDSSIQAAVNAAHQAAIPLALADARVEAQLIAQASGLSLGPLQAVSEQTNGPFGPFFGPFGPGRFGPGKFCGVVSTPIFAPARPGQRRRVVRVVRHRRCFPPPTDIVQLAVTFAVT